MNFEKINNCQVDFYFESADAVSQLELFAKNTVGLVLSTSGLPSRSPEPSSPGVWQGTKMNKQLFNVQAHTSALKTCMTNITMFRFKPGNVDWMLLVWNSFKVERPFFVYPKRIKHANNHSHHYLDPRILFSYTYITMLAFFKYLIRYRLYLNLVCWTWMDLNPASRKPLQNAFNIASLFSSKQPGLTFVFRWIFMQCTVQITS